MTTSKQAPFPRAFRANHTHCSACGLSRHAGEALMHLDHAIPKHLVAKAESLGIDLSAEWNCNFICGECNNAKPDSLAVIFCHTDPERVLVFETAARILGIASMALPQAPMVAPSATMFQKVNARRRANNRAMRCGK